MSGLNNSSFTRVKMLCCVTKTTAACEDCKDEKIEILNGLEIEYENGSTVYIPKPFTIVQTGDLFRLKSHLNGEEVVVNYNRVPFDGSVKQFREQLANWACFECSDDGGGSDSIRSCDDVRACLAPVTGAGDITVTGDYETGFVVSFTDGDTPHLTCEDVANCFGGITSTGNTVVITGDFANGFNLEITPNTTSTFVQDLTTGTITHNNGGDGSADVTAEVVSTDAEQIITVGSDGGSLLTCDNVINCLAPVTGEGNVTVTGDYENGFVVSFTETPHLTCEEVATCFGGITSSTITITGDFLNGFVLELSDSVSTISQDLTTGTITHNDGGDGSTDTTLEVVSTDTDQLITVGTDGGALLTCEDIDSCLTDTVTVDEDGNVTIVQNDDTTVTFSTKSCCPAPPIVENWDGTQTTLTIPVPPEECEVNKD